MDDCTDEDVAQACVGCTALGLFSDADQCTSDALSFLANFTGSGGGDDDDKTDGMMMIYIIAAAAVVLIGGAVCCYMMKGKKSAVAPS